jgi:hypothetical protein
MRKIFLLLSLCMLTAQPLAADPAAPLPAGKPAGVRPAQADYLLPAYGGVIFFGVILAATIGFSGSSVAVSTVSTAQAATS